MSFLVLYLYPGFLSSSLGSNYIDESENFIHTVSVMNNLGEVFLAVLFYRLGFILAEGFVVCFLGIVGFAAALVFRIKAFLYNGIEKSGVFLVAWNKALSLDNLLSI